jgi:AraC family transcriptional regulator
MSLIRTTLYESNILSVRHVECRPKDRNCGEVEHSQADVVVLPVRGAFVKHLISGKRLLAEPSQALFFAAGRPFRVSHEVASSDDSLAFEFSPDVLREILANTTATDNLLRINANSLLSIREIALRDLLLWRLKHQLAESIEIEETSLNLVSSALLSARGNKKAAHRSRQSRRSSQIDAARTTLIHNPEQKWTLSELSKNVDCSPYHLTRMFREELGLPLHQYQLRMRIARSLNALLDTQDEITSIALDCGFSSHSHFTSAFHQTVGISPTEFRKTANSQTRKNLIARLS